MDLRFTSVFGTALHFYLTDHPRPRVREEKATSSSSNSLMRREKSCGRLGQGHVAGPCGPGHECSRQGLARASMGLARAGASGAGQGGHDARPGTGASTDGKEDERKERNMFSV